ncbi:MAG TPA: hypothetical protein VGF64_03350 [Acidimicrobiales bacterium]
MRNLGAVFNDVWEDEAIRGRLIAEPRTVLAEHGIELPATVKVEAELVDAVPDAQRRTLDDFVAAWDRMVEKGSVEVKVTASRPAGVTTTELSDQQLEGVAGGNINPVGIFGAMFCFIVP